MMLTMQGRHGLVGSWQFQRRRKVRNGRGTVAIAEPGDLSGLKIQTWGTQIYYRSDLAIAAIFCADFGIVFGVCPGQNGSEPISEGGLCLNPRNVQMRLAVVLHPKRGNIAAPTAKELQTRRRLSAYAVTMAVPASFLRTCPGFVC
jgi:hypothetical protein